MRAATEIGMTPTEKSNPAVAASGSRSERKACSASRPVTKWMCSRSIGAVDKRTRPAYPFESVGFNDPEPKAPRTMFVHSPLAIGIGVVIIIVPEHRA